MCLLCVTGPQILNFSNCWPFSLVMKGLPNCQKRLPQFFPVSTQSKQVLLFPAVQIITPVKGVPSPDSLRHISTGRNTMPRTSRRNPVHDDTHDIDGEIPISTLQASNKKSLPVTKCPATEGAASAKTHPVSTRSAKSKGHKIAGTLNKRGKQIVSFATRSSP